MSPSTAPALLESDPIALPARHRFTIDGGEALEAQLQSVCDRILHGVQGLIPASTLEAIVLGGGYGRGEGGVLRLSDGEYPYNDLDLYVFLRGNRRWNERRYHQPLEMFGEIVGSLIGVEIEFKILAVGDLVTGPVSMFSYDLVARQRWLWGDEGLRERWECHRDGAAVPTVEATRLLMNRCTGLLLARERLDRPRFTPADADFVRRNIAKAELGLGDAILAAHGLYHWSCLVRHRRLAQLAGVERSPWMTELGALHARGVAFKLHPQRSAESAEALRAAWTAVTAAALPVWLHLEGRRLGTPFVSARAYAESAVNKCPCTSRMRNFLINLRQLGLRPLRQGRPGEHPRQRIVQAMALLLWEPAALTSVPLLRRLQDDLGTSRTDFPGLLAAYRAQWSRVS